MNKKMIDLMNAIKEKKAEAKSLVKEDYEKAQSLVSEVVALQQEYEIEMKLFEQEKEEISMNKKDTKAKVSNEVLAFSKAIRKQPLTEDLKAALVTTDDEKGGYLVPEELIPEIKELRRQYLSLKDFFNVVPVKTLKGSVPVEASTNTGLLYDVEEGDDITEEDLTFNNVRFDIKTKAALIPVSNTLTDNSVGLPQYILKTFTKKAIKTENKDFITSLQTKQAVAIADVSELNKQVIKSFDPELHEGAVIITNQDGYFELEDYKTADGKSLLVPDILNPAVKLFKGMKIVVLSNAELHSKDGVAPIFVAHQDALTYFDREQYAVAISDQIGFKSNKTYYRIMANYDVEVSDEGGILHLNVPITVAPVEGE